MLDRRICNAKRSRRVFGGLICHLFFACHVCLVLNLRRFFSPVHAMSARRKNKDKDKDKGTDKASTRCEWDEDADRILVTKLRECKELGMQSDSGWKPQVWNLCAEALKDTPGPPKTSQKIQDHWGKSLKAGLKSVRAVRGASGFGWDNERKMIMNCETVRVYTHEMRERRLGGGGSTPSNKFDENLRCLWEPRFNSGPSHSAECSHTFFLSPTGLQSSADTA
ncbi:hypothetical protein C8F04DRAFT_1003356 [Mycena alexandri]|uniref:Myb/SANT-like domain-containing protein n=1 Tax=Mycena alexandri TaxID=1745969 RepID=A0AAD6X5H8_9AGAR|nr:hypothetical protein C8F04DRAFT_1003356 [Mycena alexandri]